MEKSNIKLSLDTKLLVDGFGLFKSVVGIAKEAVQANYFGMLSEALTIKDSFSEDKNAGNKIYFLLKIALVDTVISLLSTKLRDIDIQDVQTDGIDKELDTLLSTKEYVIDDTFFTRPYDIPFIQDTKNVIREFYNLFEDLEAQDIDNMLGRFDSYFVYCLTNEYRTNYNDYKDLQFIVTTPFAQIEQKLLEWQNYKGYLQKEVDSPMFEESFSLRQIYIKLRGYYKQEIKENKQDKSEHTQYIYDIVDVEDEIISWIKKSNKDDALKIIRGGPGYGKSSLFKMLAFRLSSEHKVLFIPLHRINIKDNMKKAVNDFLGDSKLLKDDLFANDEKLIIVFDGLDEFIMQGKTISESAQDFITEIKHQISVYNTSKCKLQVIISGRDVIIQQNEASFREDKEVLRLLPYYMSENEQKKYFKNPKKLNNIKLLESDQRDEWWQKYATLKNKQYKSMPEDLKSNSDLDDITSQPLLNYLLSLSYNSGNIKFASKDINLNSIYEDLLIGVYNRKYQKKHNSVDKLEQEDFERILKEIGYCSWIGDGRTTTVSTLIKHLKDKNFHTVLDDFMKNAKDGMLSLLTSFYFKKSSTIQANNDTFEFTHKSFGEYLTAKRVISDIVYICDSYQKRKDDRYSRDGKSVVECMTEWTNIFGHKEIDEYLYKYIKNEIILQQQNLIKLQDIIADFLNYAIVEGLPMEKSEFKETFQKSFCASINTHKSILIIHSTIASISNKVSKIDTTDTTLFSKWLSLQNLQRDSLNVFIYDFFNHLDISNSILILKDLFCINFSNSILSNADLMGTNLTQAKLSNAKLSNAKLSNADLWGANLIRADLSDANLSHADLIYADLIYADLSHADLSNADLSNADLSNADLSDADLSNADLIGTKLIGTKLIGTKLTSKLLSAGQIEYAKSQDALLY